MLYYCTLCTVSVCKSSNSSTVCISCFLYQASSCCTIFLLSKKIINLIHFVQWLSKLNFFCKSLVQLMLVEIHLSYIDLFRYLSYCASFKTNTMKFSIGGFINQASTFSNFLNVYIRVLEVVTIFTNWNLITANNRAIIHNIWNSLSQCSKCALIKYSNFKTWHDRVHGLNLMLYCCIKIISKLSFS